MSPFLPDSSRYSATPQFLDLERQHRERLSVKAIESAAEPVQTATQVATQDVPALPMIETPPYIKAQLDSKLVQLSIFFD